MKTMYLLGILLFCVSDLFAQSPTFSIVKDNIHWVERSSTERGEPDQLETINPDYDLKHFSINGDTIKNGLVYKKLFVNGYKFSYDIREDKNNIICCCGKDGKEYVLYHFNWNDPDYLNYTDFGGKDFSMEALDSGEMVLADGNTYTYVKVNYEHSNYSHSKDLRFIQGIGLTQGIFEHVIKIYPDCFCYNDLVNLYDGNKLIYQNPLFTEQGGLAADITQGKAEKTLSVLTHKKEVIFTLKDLSGKENITLFVYNDKGEELASHKMNDGVFSLQNLSAGTYVYHLSANSADTESGKFIIGK